MSLTQCWGQERGIPGVRRARIMVPRQANRKWNQSRRCGRGYGQLDAEMLCSELCGIPSTLNIFIETSTHPFARVISSNERHFFSKTDYMHRTVALMSDETMYSSLQRIDFRIQNLRLGPASAMYYNKMGGHRHRHLTFVSSVDTLGRCAYARTGGATARGFERSPSDNDIEHTLPTRRNVLSWTAVES